MLRIRAFTPNQDSPSPPPSHSRARTIANQRLAWPAVFRARTTRVSFYVVLHPSSLYARG